MLLKNNVFILWFSAFKDFWGLITLEDLPYAWPLITTLWTASITFTSIAGRSCLPPYGDPFVCGSP